MSWHETIKEARERLGLSQAELADKVGCSQATINKIENERPTRSKFLLEIINQLGLSTADFPSGAFGYTQNLKSGEQLFHTNKLGRDPKGLITAREPSSWAANAKLEGGIPIYSQTEIADKIHTIDNDLVGITQRPPFLNGVVGAYALISADEVMSPELEPGDLLYINPRQIIVPGNICVFYSFVENETFIEIRKFAGQDEADWKVAQHTPRKETLIDRDTWTVRHRVIAKLFR